MRLVHLSDTHLGHQQFTRTVPKGEPDAGLNQREKDHCVAFEQIIDHCIATRPDLVIHSGDLFDGVRPSNRALAVALGGFVRLSQAGIPTVIIAGNHEHPKMLETGSPMRLFEHLEHIHPVFKGRRESIQVGDWTVHAVPQCPTSDALRAAVTSIEPTGQDILVLHGGVLGMDAFHHAEFNELTIDPAWFTGANAERFGYVALGHYHGTTEIAPHAWYAGAPDRVSIREAGEEKGFLEVRLGDTADVRFVALPVRPYADMPRIDATGMDAAAIVDAATRAVAGIPTGAVARLRIDHVAPDLRGGLDLGAVCQAASHLLDLDLRTTFEDDVHRSDTGMRLGGLADEFDAFVAGYPMEGIDRQELTERARDLLAGA